MVVAVAVAEVAVVVVVDCFQIDPILLKKVSNYS